MSKKFLIVIFLTFYLLIFLTKNYRDSFRENYFNSEDILVDGVESRMNKQSTQLAKFVTEIERIRDRWDILKPTERSNIYDLILFIDSMYNYLDKLDSQEKQKPDSQEESETCETFDRYCNFELKQENVFNKEKLLQDKYDYDETTYSDDHRSRMFQRRDMRRRDMYRKNMKLEQNENHEVITNLLYEADIIDNTTNEELDKYQYYKDSIPEFEKKLDKCIVPVCHLPILRKTILDELKFIYETFFDILNRNRVITITNKKTLDFRTNYAALYAEMKTSEEQEDPEYIEFVNELRLFLDICRLKLEKYELWEDHLKIKKEGILRNYKNFHILLSNKK